MYKNCTFSHLVFYLLLPVACFSQTPIHITVRGNVVGKEQNDYLYRVMVINKRTNTGTFANSDASFLVNALKSDTILFSASGYTIKKICFSDSVYKQQYNITVRLQKINYNLKGIDIYPVKSLDEIDIEIRKLGVKGPKKPTDYVSFNANGAAFSPITYLYERFSRFERSKRKVAELENEDRRREALRDLFRIYIKYDIIHLSNEDFDEFIGYCNLSDDFIKNASRYDLVMAIKVRYQQFEKSKAH